MVALLPRIAVKQRQRWREGAYSNAAREQTAKRAKAGGDNGGRHQQNIASRAQYQTRIISRQNAGKS
jgi:hypothetical protein